DRIITDTPGSTSMVLSPNLFAKFSTRRRQVGLTGSSSVIADAASARASFHRNKHLLKADYHWQSGITSPHALRASTSAMARRLQPLEPHHGLQRRVQDHL